MFLIITKRQYSKMKSGLNGIVCVAKGGNKMTGTTLRDIYWDKYGVGGMALGDLIKAMQNGLPAENHKEFYATALIRHTILTIEQILKEGNSLSNIDTELPYFYE